MAAISPISIASSTSSNWLKEAQQSLLAAANPGGLLGALNNARSADGSIRSFLNYSQNNANAVALISQNTLKSMTELITQMGIAAAQKRSKEKLALQARMSAQPTNYNPPTTLDPIIYFADGSTLDTVNNVFTMVDGTQIDAATGQEYIEPGSLIQLANGAYLDTKNNILTLADGTKIDTITHLVITA